MILCCLTLHTRCFYTLRDGFIFLRTCRFCTEQHGGKNDHVNFICTLVVFVLYVMGLFLCALVDFVLHNMVVPGGKANYV